MKRLGAILALSVVAAAACDAAEGGNRGDVVAWVDRPAPPYAVPRPNPLPYATAAPACRVDQIHATGARVGFATGNVDERLTFTNISRSSCLLTGYPAITALAPSGHRLHVHAIPAPSGTFFGTLAPAAVTPGHHVYVDLATQDVTCRLGRPFVYHDLTFRLPDGRRLITDTRLTRFCGGWRASRFGLPRRTTADLPPKPSSIDSLRVIVSLPSTAPAGATLRYLVTLANPTRTAVRLDPCPSYTEAVAASIHRYLHRAFLLNCDAVRRIGPGRRVRYEMRMRLPTMEAGPAKFSWHLNVPSEPGSSATLAITRAS